MKMISRPFYRARLAFAGMPTRPVAGRRIAPGHRGMAALRWAGVVASWTVLFSPALVAILLFALLA